MVIFYYYQFFGINYFRFIKITTFRKIETKSIPFYNNYSFLQKVKKKSTKPLKLDSVKINATTTDQKPIK